eukprot:1341573-Rhodomonas_salina.2
MLGSLGGSFVQDTPAGGQGLARRWGGGPSCGQASTAATTGRAQQADTAGPAMGTRSAWRDRWVADEAAEQFVPGVQTRQIAEWNDRLIEAVAARDPGMLPRGRGPRLGTRRSSRCRVAQDQGSGCRPPAGDSGHGLDHLGPGVTEEPIGPLGAAVVKGVGSVSGAGEVSYAGDEVHVITPADRMKTMDGVNYDRANLSPLCSAHADPTAGHAGAREGRACSCLRNEGTRTLPHEGRAMEGEAAAVGCKGLKRERAHAGTDATAAM